MTERKYKSRAPVHRPEQEIPHDKENPRREKDKLRKQIEDEMDEMLEEIDSVLESNATEMVENYIQKGGE